MGKIKIIGERRRENEGSERMGKQTVRERKRGREKQTKRKDIRERKRECGGGGGRRIEIRNENGKNKYIKITEKIYCHRK